MVYPYQSSGGNTKTKLNANKGLFKMVKLFARRKEDFTCEVCGTEVKGNGYTNHCPECLCSKHVDINPGDRASDCGGIMRPVDIEMKKGEYIIVHKCEKCGFVRRNKSAEGDNFATILAIMQEKLR